MSTNMSQNSLVTAVGIAGGTALLAPVAAPALHGIAGIAVVGLGAYAAGSAVMNTAGFINSKASELFNDSAMAMEFLQGTILSKPKPKPPVKEIPFKR